MNKQEIESSRLLIDLALDGLRAEFYTYIDQKIDSYRKGTQFNPNTKKWCCDNMEELYRWLKNNSRFQLESPELESLYMLGSPLVYCPYCGAHLE